MDEIKAVYIHIPFCKKICSYCDFCKFYYDKKWVHDYLIALQKEIKDRYMDETISKIYIGGGTPSALDDEELDFLFSIIKLIHLDDNIEFTFECNLSDVSEKLVDKLLANRVNRISIGIESFDEENLKFLEREANFDDALQKINMCKAKGLTNINVDLMYALQNENIRMLKKDLKLFLKLDVPHISTYSLMIEPNTKIYGKKVEAIDEDLDAKMYETIRKTLKSEGYEQYEVSNFAKPGYESKHNLTYWDNEEYYGFGVGASGYAFQVRYTNTRSLTKYIGGNYVMEKEMLGEKEMMDYEIILGLRKTKGINLKHFYDKFNVNLQNQYPVDELVKTGDLIHKDGNIFINPDKLYIMNEILIKLV